MKINIIYDDPLNILTSTKKVIETSKFVIINDSKLQTLASKVRRKIEHGLDEAEYGLGVKGSIEDDVQLLLIEDCVNFCFWAEKGKEKWQVEWPEGNLVNGGWYGLKTCFDRARQEKLEILNPQYLSSISMEDVKHLFRGSNGIEIPLVEKRQENLQEVGRILLKKFDGKFINAVEQSGFDTVKLVDIVVRNFLSFNDTTQFEDKTIYFLKRAQILANDISYISQKVKGFKMKHLDKLTAFADYKVPQILREEGVLVYSNDLAQKVDNYILISAGSREEIEIRSATIWGVELIKQILDYKFTSAQIDNAIWLISQDQSIVEKPYHRTYTIFY